MSTRHALVVLSVVLAAATHTGRIPAQEKPAPSAGHHPRGAPAPLFRDPVHDGAADATLIWNRAEECWWMLYTNHHADADHAYLIYFVHQAEQEPACRRPRLQIAKLGYDGNTLTCDREAEFELNLKEPAPEFTAEHIPGPGKDPSK